MVLTLSIFGGGGADLWMQTLLHVLFLAGLILYTLSRFSGTPSSFSPRHLAVVWILLFGALIFSASYSGAGDRSGESLRNWLDFSIAFWAVIQLSVAEKELLLSLLYIPWTLLLGWAGGSTLLFGKTPQASLLNPNLLAGALILPFFLSVERWNRPKSPPKTLYGIWLIACGGVLFLTRSAGGALAIGAGLFYALMRSKDKLGTRAARAGVIAAAFAGLLILKLHAGFDAHRLAWWWACVQMARAHPFAGIGVGAFDISLPHLARADLYSFYAHSSWLQWLAEFGTCGFFVLVVLIVLCGRQQANRWRTGAIIAVIFHNAIDSDLLLPSLMLFFVVWLALPFDGGASERPAHTSEFSSSSILTIFAALALMAISLKRFDLDRLFASNVQASAQGDSAPRLQNTYFEKTLPLNAEFNALIAHKLVTQTATKISRATVQLALAYELQAVDGEPVQAQYVAEAMRMNQMLGIPQHATQLRAQALARSPYLNGDKRIESALSRPR